MRHPVRVTVAHNVVLVAAVAVGCGRFHFGGASDDGPTDAAAGDPPDAADRSYAAAVLADRPIAYWRLGDAAPQAIDASDHGNYGTYAGGITQGVAGAIANDHEHHAELVMYGHRMLRGILRLLQQPVSTALPAVG